MPNIRTMTIKSAQIFRQSYYVAWSGAEVSYFDMSLSSAQHGEKELMKKSLSSCRRTAFLKNQLTIASPQYYAHYLEFSPVP
jgi:hypothetical protein